MWPDMRHLSTRTRQADALLASGLQRGDELSAGEVRQAIAAAVKAFGDAGRAGRVAQEFGDHPETAVPRLHWARAVTCRRSPIRRPARETG